MVRHSRPALYNSDLPDPGGKLFMGNLQLRIRVFGGHSVCYPNLLLGVGIYRGRHELAAAVLNHFAGNLIV